MHKLRCFYLREIVIGLRASNMAMTTLSLRSARRKPLQCEFVIDLRGITLPFLDHGTRRGWGVSVTPRPLFTLGKDPVSIVQEAGWTLGPVWTGAENLAPTGIRSPDRPARSQTLYRLSYPAHMFRCVVFILYCLCSHQTDVHNALEVFKRHAALPNTTEFIVK